MSSLRSKNPVREYRKAIVLVMSKYFSVDPRKLRFSVNLLRTHRAEGDSPAFVALSFGRDCGLPLAPEFQRRGRRQ